MPTTGYRQDRSTEDFQDRGRERTVARLPLVTIEQRSPQLALAADAIVNQGHRCRGPGAPAATPYRPNWLRVLAAQPFAGTAQSGE